MMKHLLIFLSLLCLGMLANAGNTVPETVPCAWNADPGPVASAGNVEPGRAACDGYSYAGPLAYAGKNNLAASFIPAHLAENANAVIRFDTKFLEVGGPGNRDGAEMTCHYAVTVMNEQGKEMAWFIQGYNKFLKYKNIKGVLYDAEGKKIRKLKSDEIRDVSSIASYSLYEDTRVKAATPDYSQYPYTVEYEYVLVMKSVMSFPTWNIVPGYDVAVEESQYELKLPLDREFNYLAVGMDIEPEIYTDTAHTTYTWKVEDIAPIRHEAYSRHPQEYFPGMYLGPVEITYGGITGNASSWEEYGKWVWKLVDGKQEFDQETVAEIREAYAGCSSDREIVEKLYKYMQDKVRYVNISIGLGGLEPIGAQRVHEVSYGDCKALSNYMKALLGVAGIRSVYTIVNAGENAKRVDPGIPSTSQFNHVILMVPMEQDSIWLECTSQRLPAGYLGSFTDDRTVLFVTEEGGKLGRTPAFSMQENCITTSAKVMIGQDLKASIIRDRWYSGLYFGDKYSEILNLDETKQRRQILSSLDLSGFDLQSFAYETSLDEERFVKQHVEIEDDAFVTPSGDYIMMKLNMVSTKFSLPTRVRDRKQELYIRRPGLYMDTIVYKIPQGISVEQLPDPFSISSDFGLYVSEVQQDGNQLLFIRRVEVYPGHFPAERYADYYSWYKELIRADDQQVVLKII